MQSEVKTKIILTSFATPTKIEPNLNYDLKPSSAQEFRLILESTDCMLHLLKVMPPPESIDQHSFSLLKTKAFKTLVSGANSH